MAVNISSITDPDAPTAFTTRVMSRIKELNPAADPHHVLPYIEPFLDFTLADLDGLAGALRVDTQWLLTGTGWCGPISH